MRQGIVCSSSCTSTRLARCMMIYLTLTMGVGTILTAAANLINPRSYHPSLWIIPILPHSKSGERHCSLQSSFHHKTKLRRRRSTVHFQQEGRVTIFSRGPSCQVWRQTGQELLPVQHISFPEKGRRVLQGQTVHHLLKTRPVLPLP